MPSIFKLRNLFCFLLLRFLLPGAAMSQENPAVAENDATLRALVVTGRELVPQFSPGRIRVATRVPHSVANVEIIATAIDPQARISIGGAPATIEKATAQAPVAVGRNLVTVAVTARD